MVPQVIERSDEDGAGEGEGAPSSGGSRRLAYCVGHDGYDDARCGSQQNGVVPGTHIVIAARRRAEGTIASIIDQAVIASIATIEPIAASPFAPFDMSQVALPVITVPLGTVIACVTIAIVAVAIPPVAAIFVAIFPMIAGEGGRGGQDRDET